MQISSPQLLSIFTKNQKYTQFKSSYSMTSSTPTVSDQNSG